ncbi:restriction endonuclease subunit S [Proteus vulgaris]|uniref:restriction endonuclease subunit S n=1 Tax=Proteus vulgaris TaxID=585 RepID=UPI0018C5D11D|nr:restriction endonuclease subunit S [Proteus vulgaris]MBG5969939.1 restriction endonuclease subunit S [Proteus vulgaris]
MSEWQKIQLGSVVKNISETYKFTDSQVIFLNTSDVYNNKILHSTYSSPDILPGQAKKRIKNGDLLFSEIRPVNKRFSIVNVYNPERYVVSTKLMVLRCTPKIDIEYLRFLLTSQEQLEYLQMIAEDRSGTFPQITFEHISSIWVELPPFDEQKAITSVLSSLDNKIDLLHRQNKTLEAMAETLFRQWFLEEVQDDYPDITIETVIETTSGGTPSRKRMEYYENGNIFWVKSKELNGLFINSTEEKITDEAIKNSSAKLLPKHSILIAMYGATVGEYAVISKPMSCNQAICALKPNDNYPYTYIFMYVKTQKDAIINQAVGSAQQNISQALIKKMKVSSNLGLINKYHNTVLHMFEKIEVNSKQIQTLEKLRDTLLPKLMSGEVRVNYTPEEIKQ